VISFAVVPFYKVLLLVVLAKARSLVPSAELRH
jgi:hypothetical protein